MKRTLAHETAKLAGKSVLLQGWVNTKRDHGKITFIDLRDRSGIVQIVGDKSLRSLSAEDVVSIEGVVKKRPEKLANPKLPTGKVEVEAKKVTTLSQSKELPLPIDTDGYDIEESIRLKYRYLDLRRPRMNEIIRTRSKTVKFIRDYLVDKDFVEIETPILTKTTPEGARDFIVPARLQPGMFYALPQSPQQYKQMLMVAGFERYFQIPRCFRDEDPRADRAYGEFTQLDMEMSFVTQEDILSLTEDLFTQLVEKLFPHKRISQKPWPRISHHEVMKKYGTDKPDLRKNKKDPDELAFSWTIDFPLFTKQTEEDFFHGSGSAKFAPSHHMFTSPHSDDIKLLDTDPTKVRGLQHDMVLNGYEVGGGSIRIHQSKVQEKVFDLIGFTEKQKQKFEHMLTAFQYGVPPHGGIAPGIDRFLMALLGEKSVREIIAFPTSASGQTSVMDAPSEVSPTQLQELGIQTTAKKTNSKQSLFKQILHTLKSLAIKYQLYKHPPVFTSEQAAKVRNTDLNQGAKALVMYADKKPIMVVVSAATKVDTKQFKSEFNTKDLRMATAEEVKKLTRVKIGAVPPFGSLCNLKTYCDETLSQNKLISFNAGRHDRSIEMSYQDYIRAEKPLLGKFSRS